MADPGSASASFFTTSLNDSLLARDSAASKDNTATATLAALRGTLNQGAYLAWGLEGEPGIR